MSFSIKAWKNGPGGHTPLSAEAMKDIEERLSTYTNTVGNEKQFALGTFYSVKDPAFNAKGDGSTDDSTAIQAAITAAEGTEGIVYFPASTYIIGTTITFGNNIRLVGAGWSSSIIKVKNGANIVALEGKNYGTTGVKNGAIEHLLIDGNKANTEGVVGLKAQAQNYYFHKIIVRNCDSHGFSVKLTTETEAQTVGLDNNFFSCRAIGCEGKGFNIEAHDTLLHECQAIQCKETGFYWTVNGYMIQCHSWCYDSTLESACKTGYRLATAVHCFDCIAEGATERQVEIVGNVIGWSGGEVFNGASKPNAALFEFNGGTSARILDPWCHEFGTGGAFKFTTNGQASIIRARCFDAGGNSVTNGTPHEEIYWDLAVGGSTTIGEAAFKKMKLLTLMKFTPGTVPNQTIYLDESTGRLKFKDVNSTTREFQMAASEETASANTISVSTRGSLNKISGSTEIKKINATFAGHKVTLLFTGTAKIVDGENLNLAGTFEGASGRTLTLICDGTNFYEVSRATT